MFGLLHVCRMMSIHKVISMELGDESKLCALKEDKTCYAVSTSWACNRI